MLGVQKLSNAIIAFVRDRGVVKINIVVVWSSMIGDPGVFSSCFYIIYLFFPLREWSSCFSVAQWISEQQLFLKRSKPTKRQYVGYNQLVVVWNVIRLFPHLPMGGPSGEGGGEGEGVERRDRWHFRLTTYIGSALHLRSRQTMWTRRTKITVNLDC